MTLAVATFLSTNTTGLVIVPLESPPGAAALCYLGQRHDLLLFACVMCCIGALGSCTTYKAMWDHAFVAACHANHHYSICICEL